MTKGILTGKNVLITGGSRGIGASMAHAFSEAGANVAIAYASADAPAQAVVAECVARGVTALALKCDVSSFDEATAMVADAIESLGHLDIVINNAGITRDKLAIAMSENDWDSVLDTNLKGVFAVSKAAAKHMAKRRSGRIINISSVAGVTGNAGQANYSAAKAGVIGLTKTFAREFAGRGITVNAIAPGFIQTDMTDVLSDRIKEGVLSLIPLKRLGNPEEIAAPAVFLASDAASYITGQVLLVDGGMVM